MALGPGRYDDVATTARETAEAEMVALVVFKGNQGHGFSVQSHSPSLIAMLPKMLRTIADQIEFDLTPPGTPGH